MRRNLDRMSQGLEVEMDDDRHDAIARLELEIEDLAQATERCRKFDLASKAAIVFGLVLFAAMLTGTMRADAMPVFGALACVLGGIVLFGSNSTTARELAARMQAVQAERAALIDGMELRLVPDG